jgi:hypothetical protein
VRRHRLQRGVGPRLGLIVPAQRQQQSASAACPSASLGWSIVQSLSTVTFSSNV